MPADHNPPGTLPDTVPAGGPSAGAAADAGPGGRSDVGGDTPVAGQPLNAAVAEAATQADAPLPAAPVDSNWTGPVDEPPVPGAPGAPVAGAKPEAAQDAGVLESLGRAISRPVIDAKEQPPG